MKKSLGDFYMPARAEAMTFDLCLKSPFSSELIKPSLSLTHIDKESKKYFHKKSKSLDSIEREKPGMGHSGCAFNPTVPPAVKNQESIEYMKYNLPATPQLTRLMFRKSLNDVEK